MIWMKDYTNLKIGNESVTSAGSLPKKPRWLYMENIVLTCIQCNMDFEFTALEQQKHINMGFDHPLRCPQCRRHKIDINDFGNPFRNHKFRDKKSTIGLNICKGNSKDE